MQYFTNLWQLTDRQPADTTNRRQCFFTDSQLTDTTIDQHDKSQTKLKKNTHWLTRRHSPTVTIPGKWMNENCSVNHEVYLSKQTKRYKKYAIMRHTCISQTDQVEGGYLPSSLNEWLLQDYSPPKLGTVARSEACPLGVQAAPSSIPTSGTFFRGDLVMKTFLLPFSLFRWFKKSSCQLLADECALSTGKLPRWLAQEQCG